MLYKIKLPYNKPQITANSRLHWAKKAEINRMLRRCALLLARKNQLPKLCQKVQVELHYAPRTRQRRDPSNLMPMQKALLDGLVDYDLVPDDCPPYVEELMPKVHAAGGAGEMWLEVRIIEE